MINISEGLKRDDLDGMILPMISIDEFNSKINNEDVIVVAFYSFEEDPAHDLSNFIERSPHAVLDTEVSPAPSKEGYYITFVEVKRNAAFVDLLLNILQEVNNLTNVHEWQFTSYDLPPGKLMSVNAANLKKYIKLKPQASTVKQKLAEFFVHSSLSDFDLVDDQLSLIRPGQTVTATVVSISDQAPRSAVQLSESHTAQARLLERMLDGAYTVYAITEGMVVENQISGDYLTLVF
jgi:hypothetical protein